MCVGVKRQDLFHHYRLKPLQRLGRGEKVCVNGFLLSKGRIRNIKGGNDILLEFSDKY